MVENSILEKTSSSKKRQHSQNVVNFLIELQILTSKTLNQ